MKMRILFSVAAIGFLFFSPSYSLGDDKCEVCASGCSYASIQAAINAASNGDIIDVCPGVYYEYIDFRGKMILVESTQGPDRTSIVASGKPPNPDVQSVVTFKPGLVPLGESRGFPVVPGLSGFTISGGAGTRLPLALEKVGGGIYIDRVSPTIHNCIIQGNTVSGGGGGVYCNGGSPTLVNVIIRQNRAQVYPGGGIWGVDSQLTLRDCSVERNRSDVDGAGIYLEASSLQGEDTDIRENISEGNGGGIYVDRDSSLTAEGGFLEGNTAAEEGGGGSLAGPSNFSGTVIGENKAHRGAGLCVRETSVTLASASLTHNIEAVEGGGLYLSQGDLDLDQVTLSANEAVLEGGGVFSVDSTISMASSELNENASGSIGGGVHCEGWSSLTVTASRFTGNSAEDYGGGISCADHSSCVLTSCILRGNTAGHGGGGAASLDSSLTFTNCAVNGNSASGPSWDEGGGGVYAMSGSVTLRNATLYGNSSRQGGGGLHLISANAAVSNSILWGDTSGGTVREIAQISGGAISVNYSDVQGGWSGTGNLRAPPAFAAPDDFHLDDISPCIDKGDPASAPPAYPADDLDGDPRPQGARYDMGADEFVGTPASPPVLDVKANGSDGPLAVRSGERVTFTFSLEPGGYEGVLAEWWLLIVANGRPYGIPFGQHPISRIPGTTLFSATLPEGTYAVATILDRNPDNLFGITWYDYVLVTSRKTLPEGP